MPQISDLVGKMIDLDVCKKLKFPHTNKWYMHYPESILGNELIRVLGGFEK